jgi:hypothetical protein
MVLEETGRQEILPAEYAGRSHMSICSKRTMERLPFPPLVLRDFAQESREQRLLRALVTGASGRSEHPAKVVQKLSFIPHTCTCAHSLPFWKAKCGDVIRGFRRLAFDCCFGKRANQSGPGTAGASQGDDV